MLGRAIGLRRYGTSTASPARLHDPLNILFCGSDEFSGYSLRGLHALKQRKSNKIASIEVLCRTDKPGGRGLKTTHQVPLVANARALDLPLHQINTFTGWTPPPSINLVIAVSFGLLVPARVLSGARYGGLNLHPSMLPDLYGPAPIIQTLLKRREFIGITLQTMHPTKFDQGHILAQTPYPGIPIGAGLTPEELLHKVGPRAATMLCEGVEEGLFVPPVRPLSPPPEVTTIEHAPKVTPEDRRIDWNTWSEDDIRLRGRVLDDLWDTESFWKCTHGNRELALSNSDEAKRVTFHGPWGRYRAPDGGDGHADSALKVGDARILPGQRAGRRHNVLGFWATNGVYVVPSRATVAGQKKGAGLTTLMERLQRSGKAGGGKVA